MNASMCPIEKELSEMTKDNRVKKVFVARYNGGNLVMNSGKRAWNSKGAAKLAVLHHFSALMNEYVYRNSHGDYMYQQGRETVARKKQEFKDRLFELVKIVEISEIKNDK